MTPEQLAATPQARFDREFGLRGRLHDFVERAWPAVENGQPFIDGWHIGLVCEVLEALQLRQIRKAVINIPPSCMKSSLTAVFWPVWCWIRDPREAFLCTSFDKGLTRRDAGKSLALVQSDWFRERWGDIVWIDDGASAGEHTNSAGGWRFATSTGSKATGWHPTAKIIDDPTKPQEATPKKLAEAERYYNNTLRSRQRDAERIITALIMQRLAVLDLAGVLIEEGDAHVMRLPMRYHANAFAYAKDPRTKEGELLWPKRFSEAAVKELEKMPLRDRSAQLDQNPVPDGGAIIKKDWIRWYKPEEAPRRYQQKAQTWDLSFKGTEEAHFVAGQIWGVVDANYYFIDGILERLGFVGALAAIGRMTTAHPGAAVLVEDKANGPAIIETLEGKVPGLIAVEPLGGKGARLNACSPLFEAGNVFLPIGNSIAEQLARNLIEFPVGSCDDDVDACTQFLNWVNANVVDYTALMRANPRGF